MFQTRYIEVSDRIGEDIRTGEWREKLPGVQVLARRYEVAPKTISRALKVLAQKGTVTINGTKGTFITNPGSGRKRHRTLGVVGLLRSRLVPLELQAMESAALSRKYEILTIGHRRELLEQNPALVLNWGVDGLIFTNSTLNTEVVTALRQAGIPFVSVNRVSNVPGVNWVDFDNEKGLEDGLRYLLSLGHRRIAYIAYRFAIEEHEQRIRAVYRRVMQDAGVFDEDLYRARRDYPAHHAEHGRAAYPMYGLEQMTALLALAQPPTAAFLNGDPALPGIREALEKAGIRMPDDFSLIVSSQDQGFIDAETFLTVLSCPVEQRARRAVEILITLLDRPAGQPVQELLRRELIVRESTGRVDKRR
ncbi:MAG: substrate-binding domain-containing protein [Kiritimatiellae bacterium]|nr:substrate-binding domain-containing protein [Kiritimatiellia bacterium]